MPLHSNHHHFCLEHYYLNTVCSIVDCSNQVVPGRKACALAGHQRVEELHNARGQSRFQLKECQERSHTAHPNDSLGEVVMSISEILEDEEQVFEATREGPVPVTPNSTARSSNPQICAQFGRWRTHNEQLFVAPCGMIIACETFYHTEALYSVIVSSCLSPSC